MIRIAIVEDDKKALAKLKEYLEEYRQVKDLQFFIQHYPNGLEFIEEQQRFDIIFMDIEMPIMDGLEAAKRLRKVDETACLIFVTKMAQLAVKGYEVSAMDFLIKPVQYFEFGLRMDRVTAYLKTLPKDEVVLESKSGMQRLDLSEILYIEAFAHEMVFHTTRGEYSVYGTLKEYEERFSDKNCARLAKSFLVNLKHVLSYTKDEIMLSNQEKLTISRSYKKAFLNSLTRYFGEIFK